jgi:hypothetical protein
MKPLSPWAMEAEAHWRKYRPKMYREMEQSGELNDFLAKAARRAMDQCAASVAAGMHPLEAESEAKRNYLLLPDEEDVPLLGENPDALPDPANLMTAPGVNRRKRPQKQNGPRVN